MQSKNKFFITSIFLFILILIYGCKTTDTSKKQSYSQAEYFNIAGNRAKEKKDGTRAIYYYTKAIEADPAYVEAYLNRGEAYIYLGEHEKALADFDKVIELDSQADKAYYWKVVFLVYSGQENKALENLNKSIELNDKNYKYYETRSRLYIHFNEFEKSLDDINIAIKLNPKSAELYDLQGSFYIELKRYDDAINAAKTAISLDSKYLQAYHGLILAYMYANKHNEAFEAINKTIKLKPLYIDMLYVFRAGLSLLQGRDKEAIEDCNASIKINPHNASIYNVRGTAYLEIEEYKKAIKDFDMAIKFALENQNTEKQDAIEYKQKAYEALAEMERK